MISASSSILKEKVSFDHHLILITSKFVTRKAIEKEVKCSETNSTEN